ncbi:MAG TPA: FHA domain-containing protein [Gemmatimonadales bacterium]|nr:FHA domain-containing protein [Gemmatimonadales bacterium]
MQLEVGGRRIPVATGDTVIGSAPWCTIVLEGEGVRPHHAVVQGTPEGAAAIRTAGADAEVSINGVRLGTDPTPVLHGDKIQIFGHEILAVDPQRAGNTQLFDSGAFADLPPVQAAKSPPGPTGGRVVCLTDGREYTVKEEPLVFGRDAASDVVVTSGDVSRRHAEIRATPEGYVLMDHSANGTFVNGKRVSHSQLLARADVIRIGTDEFRFYADASPRTSTGQRSVSDEVPLHTPTGAVHRLSDTMHGVPLAELAREAPPGPPTPPAAVALPIASLLVRSGALRGRRLPVTIPTVNIGRADYNDLVIADPSVSTTHAKLQRKDDVWVLTDLGSTNGTYVEGEPVTGETALTPGTTIRFGDVAALFEPHDEPQSTARPPATAVPADPGAIRPPELEEAPAGTRAEAPRAAARRPIRAAAPRPTGPPTWLIALLILVALIVAYVVLTSS